VLSKDAFSAGRDKRDESKRGISTISATMNQREQFENCTYCHVGATRRVQLPMICIYTGMTPSWTWTRHATRA